jgi:hypothetical protein
MLQLLGEQGPPELLALVDDELALVDDELALVLALVDDELALVDDELALVLALVDDELALVLALVDDELALVLPVEAALVDDELVLLVVPAPPVEVEVVDACEVELAPPVGDVSVVPVQLATAATTSPEARRYRIAPSYGGWGYRALLFACGEGG